MDELAGHGEEATLPGFEPRTGEDVAEQFREMGVPVAAWARANGFSASLVYRILGGQQKCLRGQSHQIAVRLGLKRGRLGDLDRLQQELTQWQSVSPL